MIDYVTVRQLKKLIEEADDNDVVIISKDSEGNEYKPLSDISFDMRYKPEDKESWWGYIGHKILTQDMIEEGYTKYDIIEEDEDTRNCIVLYPVN